MKILTQDWAAATSRDMLYTPSKNYTDITMIGWPWARCVISECHSNNPIQIIDPSTANQHPCLDFFCLFIIGKLKRCRVFRSVLKKSHPVNEGDLPRLNSQDKCNGADINGEGYHHGNQRLLRMCFLTWLKIFYANRNTMVSVFLTYRKIFSD